MNTNEISTIAALVGEPARTAMLVELMSGRALTANELAEAAHVTPQTASRHLARLVDAKLLTVQQLGRHRYHRLASPSVATMLESITQLAALNRTHGPTIVTGPRERRMRYARMCYDHVAGHIGVAIADHLVATGAIVFDGNCGQVTEQLPAALANIGLDFDVTAPFGRRVLCRPCLDWSERRFHIAGRLGHLLADHLLKRDWLRRRAGSRSLDVTMAGHRGLRRWLGAGFDTLQAEVPAPHNAGVRQQKRARQRPVSSRVSDP